MSSAKCTRKPLSSRQQQIAFLFTNFVYLVATHFLSLNLYPVGVDFPVLGGTPHVLSDPLVPLDTVSRDWFGANLYAYHLLNLALLYACMVGVFYLTKTMLQGPWWLGSLAAVLVMANPIKNAQVLMLSTAPDLFVQALAIASLAFYAHHTRRGHWFKLAAAYTTFAVAVLPAPRVAALGIVFLLYELALARGGWKGLARLTPLLLPTVWHAPVLLEGMRFMLDGPWGIALALWLPFYPIGLLPETYELVRSSSLISWSVVGMIAILTYKVYRWSGHRAVPVLVGSVLLTALLRGVMISGADGMQPSGMIIVALALLAIAVAAVFHQVMQHPKWQRHVVQLTTLLCVVMMAIQVWSILNWRHAGQQMLALQARTAVTAKAHPGEELALIASMQCYRGVPLYLPAGIMYDSPFSRAYPIKNIFVVPYARPETRRLTLEAYGPEEIRVRVEPRGEADDLYYPDFWRVGEEFLGTRVEATECGYRLIATTKPDRPFPEVWIPYRVHQEATE